jgi:hypothetical protein
LLSKAAASWLIVAWLFPDAAEAWSRVLAEGLAEGRSGNVGYLDVQPVLFPAAICAEVITAAMSLLADTDALIIDLRHCLGGEPAMTAFIISYFWDSEPAQLTGLRARKDDLLKQAWSPPENVLALVSCE